MNIEAIVFDLGGTLIEYSGPYDNWPDLETPGFTAAYDFFSQDGLTMPDFEQFRDTGFALLPIRWQMATSGEKNLRLVDLLADVLAACETNVPGTAVLQEAAGLYQEAICSQAAPLEGAQETLAQLNGQGYRIGLISNTMFTGAVHKVDLARFGLDSYFETMLFSADVNRWKPSPGAFLQVLSVLGTDPSAAVFVGDDPVHDIIGGKRLGMYTIHICSSQRFPDRDGVQPDATIDGLSELPPLLAQLQEGGNL